MIIKRFGAMSLIIALLAGPYYADAAQVKKRCVSPSSIASYLDLATADEKASRVRVQTPLPRSIATEGNILLTEATPELLILSNSFDLPGKKVQFRRAIRSRYTYSIDGADVNTHANESIHLGDDASVELILANFAFPFGKKTYNRCFINSNGSITFESPDPEPPTAENLSKGPPRIAALFADLNPENIGTILIEQNRDAVIVTWLRVPEFYNQDQFDYGENTFQIILYADGSIDVAFADITAKEAYVGLFPGRTRSYRSVDFSRGLWSGRPSSSFVENFHSYESVRIPELMRSIYENIPDKYDFVTLLSNFDLNPVPGAQAFSINVRNNVVGIGNPSADKNSIFKENSKYGSEGRLQNITFLGNINQYPSSPNKNVADMGTSLLEILAHEVGHRWLSYIKVNRDGQQSNRLLGRDKSHWSFFLDTGGSYLEGNQISTRSSNSFVTGTPYQKYSPLDLYLMGFIPAREVPDTFYVTGADNFSPDFSFRPESVPEPDIRFDGSAIRVSIQDVIAANGERNPSSNASQKTFRHLFVLLVKSQQPATAEELQACEILRTEWESFFSAATGGRAQVLTNIQ